MKELIKIAIVDDDRLFVQLLADKINDQNGLEVTHVSYGGEDWLQHLEASNNDIDIVILDLRMSDGDGLTVLDKMNKTSEEIKIIVLSTFYRRSFMGQMLKMGANAFLPKEVELDELLEVIITVKNQGHYFSKEQVAVMRSQLSNKLPKFHLPQKDGLTERETEILKLLCQQYSTKEIGDRLFISPKTVESHKTNLILKAGVKNMAGLVIYAIQNNIVNASEVVLLDR